MKISHLVLSLRFGLVAVAATLQLTNRSQKSKFTFRLLHYKVNQNPSNKLKSYFPNIPNFLETMFFNKLISLIKFPDKEYLRVQWKSLLPHFELSQQLHQTHNFLCEEEIAQITRKFVQYFLKIACTKFRVQRDTFKIM